jgi:hypothetical protein
MPFLPGTLSPGVFIGPVVYIQDFDAATIHQRHS